MTFEQEVRIVEEASIALRSERADLGAELDFRKSAASTGLELHGIIGSYFKEILRSEQMSDPTVARLRNAVEAIRVIYEE
jgi:hypothetical protein